jgi:hypothetical protein
MKQKTQALKWLLILSAFFMPLKSIAQDEVGDLFKGSPDDASKLAGAYLNPLFKGLGLGLNSGWHTSAKTKGLLRFDVRITGTLAFVPKEDQSYDVRNLNLQTISPVNPTITTGPTAFGKDQEGARMRANGAPVGFGEFNLPEGTGIHFVPSPQVQLTVGLPKNIDISLRAVPSISLGDDAGKISLFGVGAKVELLPLIMGKKEKLLPFDLALGLGFTRLNYNLPLDVNGDPQNNQELDIKINGFSAEAIISKQLLFFTPFASVGYNTASTNLRALGTYQFDTPTLTNPNAKTTYTDPFNIKNDLNGLRASLGFQLKLGFFKLYAAYTQAEYGYINGGIGFGIGK